MSSLIRFICWPMIRRGLSGADTDDADLYHRVGAACIDILTVCSRFPTLFLVIPSTAKEPNRRIAGHYIWQGISILSAISTPSPIQRPHRRGRWPAS